MSSEEISRIGGRSRVSVGLLLELHETRPRFGQRLHELVEVLQAVDPGLADPQLRVAVLRQSGQDDGGRLGFAERDVELDLATPVILAVLTGARAQVLFTRHGDFPSSAGVKVGCARSALPPRLMCPRRTGRPSAAA